MSRIGVFKSAFLLSILFVSVSHANGQDADAQPQEPHDVSPAYEDGEKITWSPRIVNGTAAQQGEFPGMVSIQHRSNRAHFCGGTLIDASHVLTAAHCVTENNGAVYAPSRYSLMGNALTVSGSAQSQHRDASHVFVHTGYNIRTFQNDIAVIRLSQPFNATTTFYPIPRITSAPLAGSVCSVAGWGTLRYGTNEKVSEILLRINATVISRTVCNGSNSYKGAVLNGMLCAGDMNGYHDSCQGDSGGGLICGGQVSGVVSFGNGCAERNYPGVYADVANYNSWIQSTLIWNGGAHSAIPTPPTQRPNSASMASTSLLTIFSAVFFIILK